jgi:hypothetical protein
MNTHRLRQYASESITDDELCQVDNLIDFDEYEDWEHSGHFILTKDGGEISDAVDGMCCGIHEEEIELESGEIVYFAFDYGH